MSLANLSLERIHSLCFNRGVNSKEYLPVAPPPATESKIVAFSDLRLPNLMTTGAKVLFEYEDQPGGRSFHEVSLTCSGKGANGNLYLGGYDSGKFSVFRAECIHRVVML